MGNALIRVLFWQACLLGGVVQADDPKIERLALDNGLTVLLRPVAETQQVATVLLYSIGSDHDPPGRCGMGHLMEHVYVTAAAGDTPAREVRQYTQLYPGGWNAQTGNRYTVVATVTAHKDLDRELADVAARMGDLKITAEDLQREIPRLVQEVGNMFGGIPSLAVGNLARERLRPTPHGGRRGGLPDQVRQVTAEQLQKRWTRYYKPANAILVVVGGF
ncbi:MAG: insulinase family protein, partial [Planctomycetes bacterium]|nr:insulinase family protein [Planctomycetota bacterium]